MAKNFSIAILIKAIDKATSVFDRVGDSSARVGKRLKTFGKGWSTNVSAPLAGLGALSFKASLDFDNAMDKLLTQTDTTREQMEAWKQQILRDAPDLGVGPQTMAEALLAAVSAGEEGARAYDTMREAAKGEALQLGNAVDLVNIATGVTENYGKANISTAEALSILLATINQGKGEASELAPVMGPSISMAQALGISFDQVGAAMAAFTVKSVPAAQAATQVEGILRNLNKITPQSAKEFKRLGLTYAGIQKSLKEKGLYQTLLDINKAAKGQKQVLATLFPDTQAYAGVIQLVNDEGGKMKIAFDAVRDHAETMDSALAKIAGGSGDASRKSLAALRVTSIEFGEALSVVLVPLLKQGTVWLKSAARWFDNLSPGLKKFATGALLGAVVLGPLVILLGGLVTVGGAAVAVIGAIGAPVWAVVAAITALVGTVTWAITDWKGFVKFLADPSPFHAAQLAADALSEWLFGMDMQSLGEHWMTAIQDGLKSAWEGVKSWFRGALIELLNMLPDFMRPSGLIRGLQAAQNAAPPPPSSGPRPAASPASGASAWPSPRNALRAGVDAARKSGAMVPWKDAVPAKADITVDFRNAPPGTRVNTKADKNTGLTVDLGYAMAN